MKVSVPASRPTQLLYNGYRISCLGIKWPEHSTDHPSSHRTKVVYG